MVNMKKTLKIEKIIFPAIMTVLSFITLLSIYLFSTSTMLNPLSFNSLIFAAPFFMFGIITLLACMDIIKINTSTMLTFILIPVLAAGTLFCSAIFAPENGRATDNITNYKNAIKRYKSSHDKLNFFPSEIPKNTIDFKFSDESAGFSSRFILNFKTNPEDIHKYADEFSAQAEWLGYEKEAGNRMPPVNIDFYENHKIPEDFIVYILYSNPYQNDSWNHGEIHLVAISEQRNEIVFYAESW